MAEDSDLERTEQPTGRRLDQAREEGQVPHSRELSSFLVLIASAAIFWSFGGWMIGRVKELARSGLIFGADDLRVPQTIGARLASLSFEALVTLSPVMLATLAAVLVSPFLLNAWVFSPSALLPKFSRLNPIQGLGRVFSVQGLVELVKALLKATLIGGAAVWLIWHELGELVGLLAEPLDAGLAHSGRLIAYSFLLIVAAMVLIVAVDVPFQIWSYYDKLKMTKEEVKQEGKEMEGDPHVKGRIRSLQREAARRRMMASVPTADVIVTNPTHFSVALAYKSGMSAPKVVAKGRGEIALKIREVGGEHGVPLLEAPPLARALYRWADIDQEIPNRLYAAVAEVLAYVYQLNHFRQFGGQYPTPPRNLEVPAELDPEIAHG
jgi:flagellar biosynthesis protein FlhB